LSWLASEMSDLQSNAAQVGIKLNLEPQPINQITAVAAANCVAVKISCDWDMANYEGFTFSPDYLPTGDVLYLTGATSNYGGYSNAENDAMIEKTLTSPNLSYMYSWQDYLATQLPVEWQPFPAYQLTEVANNLEGVTPQSTTLSINPENWYFVK
jgi:peptide/nickel transport system substrate-binding protein